MEPETTQARAAALRAFRVFGVVAGLALAFAALPVVVPTPAARADEPAGKTEEKTEEKAVASDAVYFGDAREWAKPAEVDADAVYGAIPEYRQIVDEKIDPSDAKYDLLMAKARKKFVAAIRTVAKDGGYDLIARVGSVKGAGAVPNVTTDVVAKL